MSEDSIMARSVDLDYTNLEDLCARVHKKLSGPLDIQLPVASHRSAAFGMLKVRDIILRGKEVSQAAKMSLLCAGIICLRRTVCGVEDEGNVALLRTTQALLFSLLSIAEPKAGAMDIDAEAYAEGVGKEEGGAVEECGERSPKRVRRDPTCSDQHLLSAWKSECLANKISEFGEENSSCYTMSKSDTSVSIAALKEAAFIQEQGAMNKMYELSCIFFRCSSAAMVSSMLASVQLTRPVENANSSSMSFLTLDTISMLNDANEHQDEKLKALADAAESETGQALLRDLILSFKLPQSAVGMRRSVCLTRAANTMATKQFPEILNVAHDAAMRGSTWSYESDPDPIHKIASLLAGFAISLIKDKSDIRRGCELLPRTVHI